MTLDNTDYPLTKEENELIIEIKRLDRVKNITRLTNNFLIGKKINDFYQKDYGEDEFAAISDKTGINKSSLYKYCQLARDFTEDDIELFTDSKCFGLSYSWLRDHLTLGRAVIVKLFEVATDFQQFKASIAELKSKMNSDSKEPEGKDAGGVEEKNAQNNASNSPTSNLSDRTKSDIEEEANSDDSEGKAEKNTGEDATIEFDKSNIGQSTLDAEESPESNTEEDEDNSDDPDDYSDADIVESESTQPDSLVDPASESENPEIDQGTPDTEQSTHQGQKLSKL
ncbi:hypothetical protein, partial [Desulfamplus magnetovallimortis]|uniref:hypothetical protein n=1 Tax=Desulfamplus magnetovallimortis TaxID=1246637 RepID=UPI001C985E8B